MPAYKLYYFDAKGSAESIRFLFAQGGVAFEDVRIQDREKQFPPIKAKSPMGQVPLLEVDGKMLGQSKAIGRYLAKEFKLAGKTAWDQAQVDMYIDGVADCLQAAHPALMAKYGNQNGKYQELWTVFKGEGLKKFLENYSNFLGKSKSGWLVGDEVTWADLHTAAFVDGMSDLEPGILEQYPKMKQHRDKVFALPKIAAWVAKRPKTQH